MFTILFFSPHTIYSYTERDEFMSQSILIAAGQCYSDDNKSISDFYQNYAVLANKILEIRNINNISPSVTIDAVTFGAQKIRKEATCDAIIRMYNELYGFFGVSKR